MIRITIADSGWCQACNEKTDGRIYNLEVGAGKDPLHTMSIRFCETHLKELETVTAEIRRLAEVTKTRGGFSLEVSKE